MKPRCCLWMIINPGFVDRNRSAIRYACKVLVVGQTVVERSAGQLSVETQVVVNDCVGVEPQTITGTDIVCRADYDCAGRRIAQRRTFDRVKTHAEISAEPERSENVF